MDSISFKRTHWDTVKYLICKILRGVDLRLQNAKESAINCVTRWILLRSAFLECERSKMNIVNADADVSMLSADEIGEESCDSDRELQIAFDEGLLKSDKLNYVVEKKKPIINKKTELEEKVKKFNKNLSWLERLDVTVNNGHISEKAISDDFEREIVFYKQAEKAVQIAIPRLREMGVKIFRPGDYYAEMVKSDRHMQKVRERMAEIEQNKQKLEAIRRIRNEKKFAAKVQKKVMERKQNEKKILIEEVKKHRKGIKSQLDTMLNNAKRMCDNEVEVKELTKEKLRGRKKFSRIARNKKFGFGGQKKRSKKNDKNSFEEIATPRSLARKLKGFHFGSKSDAKQRRKKKTSFAVSLGNCFACGIFLSSCFLGLLPHIRKHGEHIQNVCVAVAGCSDLLSYIFLNSELVVLMGFLLILFLEEVVHMFHGSGSRGICKHSVDTACITNGKTSENVLSTVVDCESSACNSGLMTLLKWDEDIEPLVSENPSAENFADPVDNTPSIEFRHVSDEVFQKHKRGIYFHSGLHSSNLSLSTFVLLFGLSMHSLFEGIALGLPLISTEFYSLLFAIMLHEILCSFAFGANLAHQKSTPKTAFISSLVLAGSIPTGMSSSLVINSMETFTSLLIRFVLEGFAAGTLIYVACIEMLSSELSTHEQDLRRGLLKNLISMAGSAFRKIIRLRSTDWAVLDESAYYETIYEGNSVPNRTFYSIHSPFRMDSEAKALFEKESAGKKHRSKQKRRNGISSNIAYELQKVNIILKKALDEAIKMDAFNEKQQESALLDFNNYLVRNLALNIASVPCPLSRYDKLHYVAGQSIKEIFLDHENRIIDHIPNELIMWINASPEVITAGCKGEEFILPPFSAFIVNDAYGKRFDFILLDPPWENRSVRRKSVYPIYADQTSMLDFYLPELLEESGLLAVWVTNNAKHLEFVNEMIEYFGFVKIATWRWLKVTSSGEPVYNLDSQHKQPFESIIFASTTAGSEIYTKIVDDFVLISTPSAIHSRKPPLLPVLQTLGILKESALQLELYGRYLLPRTTTVGFEALRLQNKRYFV
uniref:Uncharacterized protein n=1 Tax=Setaria digitata TaxID=48799 RepID=A0A915Q1D1_9BILA